MYGVSSQMTSINEPYVASVGYVVGDYNMQNAELSRFDENLEIDESPEDVVYFAMIVFRR